jgi:hypothetical protein
MREPLTPFLSLLRRLTASLGSVAWGGRETLTLLLSPSRRCVVSLGLVGWGGSETPPPFVFRSARAWRDPYNAAFA